ncbi:MAG: hypothetical protein IKN32_00840 [Bacteroidales bacterium]|nr:hypothetical protein [Bacteroidales bacterium]
MSYANMILYGATLPSFHKSDKEKGESLKADDPRNTEKVKAMIEMMK